MSPKIANILVVIAVIAFSLVLFTSSMTKPLGHDEQMHCSGAVLLAQGKMIYRDFSYIAQMPYHPLLCAVLFKVFNTNYYLFTARTLSVVCDILTVIAVIGIYRSVFKSFPMTGSLLGIAGAVLYLFNPFVDYANGFAWNHDCASLLVLLSLWIFLSIDFKQKSGYLRTPFRDSSLTVRVAIIAALLSLATCMRITTAIVQLLFFAALLFVPADSAKERVKIVLPFVIAAAVILVWPIWVIAAAPRAFFINLFMIPSLNSQWLHQAGMFYRKGQMMLIFLTVSGSFLLIVIAAYLCVAVLWNRRRLAVSNKRTALLAVWVTIVFFIIAFVPPTIWLQYFAAPVLFLIISFAYPLLYLRKLAGDRFFGIAAVLMAVCAIVTVISGYSILQRVPRLCAPQTWTPIKVHNLSQDIAAKTKSPKLILTLAPLYAMEGGCDIYTELSAGPFAYRVADYLSASDRKITHTTGLTTIGKLFEKSPPSAVVLGAEPKILEEPIWEAVNNDSENTWERKQYGEDLVVYFRR